MKYRWNEVYLATKRHDRSYDGSMRLLECKWEIPVIISQGTVELTGANSCHVIFLDWLDREIFGDYNFLSFPGLQALGSSFFNRSDILYA